MCTCLKCGSQNGFGFEEPFPKYGDQFIRYCKHCQENTTQTMILTKNVAKELHKKEVERELKQSIIDYCKSMVLPAVSCMNRLSLPRRFQVGNFNITKAEKLYGMKAQ